MPHQNRPVHEIRLAQIRVSIWSNQGNGNRAWYSVSISRVYRDGDVWKDSTSFGRDDLPLVAKAAEMGVKFHFNVNIDGVDIANGRVFDGRRRLPRLPEFLDRGLHPGDGNHP